MDQKAFVNSYDYDKFKSALNFLTIPLEECRLFPIKRFKDFCHDFIKGYAFTEKREASLTSEVCERRFFECKSKTSDRGQEGNYLI